MDELRRSRASASSAPLRWAPFPETNPSLLAAAAAGNWEPFFQHYLRPCWRELVIVCRGRGLDLPDAEELLQELTLRIIQQGKLNARLRSELRKRGEKTGFQANLAGRYLRAVQLELRQPRFRTYLKGAILNIVREALRKKSHRAQQSLGSNLERLEPWVEQSISHSLDQDWMDRCVSEAAARLRAESLAAPTQGKRRWFDILYLSVAESQTAEQIAEGFGVRRATIAGQLAAARARFVELLQQATGASDLHQLKQMVREDPQSVKEALRRARERVPDQNRTAPSASCV